MDLHLDGFPGISGNALEVSRGDLRGWPCVHPDVASRGTGGSIPQGSATELMRASQRRPHHSARLYALHNHTRLTFTVPVLLVGH